MLSLTHYLFVPSIANRTMGYRHIHPASKTRYAIITDAKVVQTELRDPYPKTSREWQVDAYKQRDGHLHSNQHWQIKTKDALWATLEAAVKRHGGSGFLTSSPLVCFALEGLAAALLGAADGAAGAVGGFDTRPGVE
jgi:hypothetical protein